MCSVGYWVVVTQPWATVKPGPTPVLFLRPTNLIHTGECVMKTQPTDDVVDESETCQHVIGIPFPGAHRAIRRIEDGKCQQAVTVSLTHASVEFESGSSSHWYSCNQWPVFSGTQ